MEDSEKRKQMLKAMRMEAAAAAAAEENDCSASLETSTNTSHLSNPLAETSTRHQEPYESQRFDYYTDPMSAYSSFKRNKTPKQQHISSPSHQISSPSPPQLPPSLPGSLGSEYRPHTNHGGFQAAHYNGDNLYPEPRGPPTAWNNNFRPPPVNHFGPNQWIPRPYPFPPESPGLGNNRFGGRGSYDNRPPQFSHYGRGNSNRGGNMYPSPGRGRGRGMKAGFGRGGGRQHAEQGAERFYSNSMAEDPWKYLKPVLWKSCSDASSSNTTSQAWLPKSIAPKEPMTSEASHKPNNNNNNQQSLAEYLAASLDAATSDEPSN